ncbi:hypothetical protein CR513_03143, partial [Mucuna pruriens]
MIEEAKILRENIFHFRCHVLGNLCFVIIDGGSCVNVASERLVSKSALPIVIHLRPVSGELPSRSSFTIGKYEDKVLCDLVLMEAPHLLLGRPWQYDKKVIHDGVTNMFTFIQTGRKVVLKPLSLKTTQEDKKKRKKREKKRNYIKKNRYM